MAQGRTTFGRVLAVCLMGTHVIACTSSSPGNAAIEQLNSDTSRSTPNIGTGDKPDVSQPPAPDTGPIVDTAPEPEDIASQDASTLDAEVATDTTGPTDSGASDTGTLEDTEGSDTETGDAIAPPEDTSPIDEDTGPNEDTGPEPGCVPGSATCDGQEVVVCGPTGDAWFVVATCSEDKPCIDGTCCSPQCAGKSCGDDGCGGLCGTCEGGWSCADDGQCETAPECEGDAPCNDGNPCTEDDTCTDGLCVGHPIDCEDEDPCTQTGCDETGCYAKPTDCDDDDPCTDDGCNSQGCFHKPATCDDGVSCTDDSCGAAGCEYTVQAGACLIDDMCVTAGTIPDDNTCLICDPGESNTTWSPQGPVTCDDDNVCTVGDVCDGDTCVGGTDVSCGSDSPCESATCDPVEGCVTTPVADGDTCTMPCFGEATCQGGSCEAVPESAVVCPASAEPCVASIGCDPATGVCTVEAYVPKGVPCEGDESVCSIEACDGDGACMATGEAESCEDESADNPCWDYSCQPTTGCVQTAFIEGATCDDLNGCTMGDLCSVSELAQQVCIGSPIPIDDDNPCTNDSCQDGVVNHEPIDGMACDPESPCTNEGICDGGVCEATTTCECTEDGDCPETEICVEFACTGTYCGNGICDPGDDTDCPNDCSSCTQAIWCDGACGDPVFGKPLCANDCCGDGFCANTETAECCPADCTPETTCDDAQVIDSVPAELTGDNSDSNALFATLASTCGDTVFPGLDLFDFGEGREDVYQFIAPFSGTFGFQLSASWSSQMWFFTDCEDAGATCIESADMSVGQTSTLAGLDLEAGDAIFVVVDSGSLTFGDGPYTLLIDGLCTPSCGGNECGDDGCGGSCGECADDEVCQDGACEDAPCLWDYEPLHFDPCATEAPTGPLLLTPGGTYTYNTDDGTLTGPNAVDPATEVLTTLDPEVRLMIVDRLELPGDTTLEVVGAMPLAVVSWDDIDIQGTVDVSSTLSQLGAGANPSTCGSGSGTGDDGTASGNGSGGGGGGGGLGGDGGDGASPGGNGSFGGDHGVKIGPPDTIRGGCAGGRGGTSGGGDGGGGGGALYLAAQHSISISGVLHAGGAGGEGGHGTVAAPRSGGGGGGSGGYLGLEAPTVTLALNAVLAANGGGGGGGTDITHAGNGAHGPAADAPAAAGGQGHGNGGSGGIGAISGTPDGGHGLHKSNTRGAGGAGGGLGFIIVNSPVVMDQGATLSAVTTLACTPVCGGAVCGDDGCGGSCGECEGDAFCTDGGECIDEGDVCDYQLDCPATEVCGWWPTDGINRCSNLCTGPNDCAAGEVCDRVPGSAHIAYCRSAGDGGATGEACTWDEACASGICLDGLCRETCVSQTGCPIGQVCEALDWWFGPMSACTPTSGTQAGDVCGACASSHCDFLALPGPPKCASLCATTSDCGVNQTCNFVDHTGEDNWDTVPYHPSYDADLTDAIMGCYTSTGGLGDEEDGEQCNFDQNCESGTCLPIVDSDSSGYCTRPCVQSTDCSNGMVCRLTIMNLASKYLFEDSNAALGNSTLVRLCDFPTGDPGGQ